MPSRALPATGIPGGELNEFAAELPTRLIDYLVIRNLEGIPGAAESADFIGFAEITDVPATDAQHPAFTRRKLHLDQLTGFITNPLNQLKSKYQWGDPAFTGLTLLQKVTALLARAGVPAVLDMGGPQPVLDLIFVEVTPRLDVDPKGLLITIKQPFDVDASEPFVQDDFQIRVVLNTEIVAGLKLILQPNDGVTLFPPTGIVQGDLLVEWTGGKTDGTPYLILGEPGSSRLEAKQLVASAGVGFAWNAAQNRAEGTFTISGEIKNGHLSISLASADGFIGKILGGLGLESDFGVGFGFSTKQGFFFHGSATLDIQLPLHIQLGPVELTALTLTVGIQGNTSPIGLRTDIKAALGPIEGVVQQIGAGVDISLPDKQEGQCRAGGFQADVPAPEGRWPLARPRRGEGRRIPLHRPGPGRVRGHSRTVARRHRYRAIGIITTKLPDGSKGFSLLLILTADFGTGIQLGFGFTLLAVGGLIGLNRTINLQALMDGVRSGSIESIMFPKDVVANAPKIISDLRIIFPPQEGKFLIGPMVKLGWGTPTLVSVSLGIIIEIPGNIAILGILKIAIPGR